MTIHKKTFKNNDIPFILALIMDRYPPTLIMDVKEPNTDSAIKKKAVEILIAPGGALFFLTTSLLMTLSEVCVFTSTKELSAKANF